MTEFRKTIRWQLIINSFWVLTKIKGARVNYLKMIVFTNILYLFIRYSFLNHQISFIIILSKIVNNAILYQHIQGSKMWWYFPNDTQSLWNIWDIDLGLTQHICDIIRPAAPPLSARNYEIRKFLWTGNDIRNVRQQQICCTQSEVLSKIPNTVETFHY